MKAPKRHIYTSEVMDDAYNDGTDTDWDPSILDCEQEENKEWFNGWLDNQVQNFFTNFKDWHESSNVSKLGVTVLDVSWLSLA